MIASAPRAIAGHELAARWRSVVVLGLLAGILGGGLLAGSVVVRRTDSAPQRLVAAVDPGDVRIDAFATGLLPAIVALPQVDRASTASIAIGQVDGPGFVYLGILAPDDEPAELLHPVVLRGRSARPEAVDEVVVIEDVAAALDLEPGDTLGLGLLTAEEVGQFDTGFGEPDGPRVDVEVVGIVRVPPDVVSGTPVFATPAFGEQLGESRAGSVAFLEVDDDARAAFGEEAAALAAAADPVPGAEELPPLTMTEIASGTEAAERSARVVVVGMGVALAVAALAASVVLWQGLVRHHAATVHAQAVEHALGATAHERAVGRAAPLSLAGLLAAVIAFGVALAGGGLLPVGAVRDLEPDSAWRADPSVMLAGPAVLGVIVVVAGYATARDVGARKVARRGRSPILPRWAPRRSGWALMGSSFAVSSESTDGAVPSRAALVGAVLGMTGIVAAVVVGASLDRLVSTPTRWGWQADLVVVDVTDEDLAELAADRRISGLADVGSASLAIEGSSVPAYALASVSGDIGWTVVSGRDVAADDEIVLGTRTAASMEVEVGDVVEVAGPEGPVDLDVVGIGIGPTLGSERLGESAAVSPDALERLATVQLFREALVDVDPDAPVDQVVAALGERYEIGVAEPPRSVRDLAALDRLPFLLAGFLGVLAIAALAHGLSATVRRRARDLSLLVAIGGTRRQVAMAVMWTAVAIAVAATLVGVPFGLLLARLVWGEIAEGAGVADDLALPALVLWLLVAVPLVAVVVAAWPAHVGRRRATPGQLRTE